MHPASTHAPRLAPLLLALLALGCPQEADAPGPAAPMDAATAAPDMAGGDVAELPFDQALPGEGPRWEVWAPQARAVDLVLEGQPHPMQRLNEGLWAVRAPRQPGQRYHLRITPASGGASIDRPDPWALQLVPGSEVEAVVVEPETWSWGEEEASWRLPALEEMVIYELHPGSFRAGVGGVPGGFEAAIEGLDHLADLGVNVIELMPVHEFPGELSWGYNPQHLFAAERSYGGPAGLKRFVEEAHRRGMAVILDVVYNHLDAHSPVCHFEQDLAPGTPGCGAYFYQTGELAKTDWGPRPDFGQPQVRRWLRDNALMWLEHYHLDGLRWDSTGNIRALEHGYGPRNPEGWSLIREIHEAIRQLPGEHLSVAEDLRGEPRITQPLVAGGAGFDAQWDAGFHATIVDALERPGEGDIEAVAAAIAGGQAPWERVIFVENHDTTGELNGRRRLPDQLAPDAPSGPSARRRAALGLVLTLTSPGVPMLLQGQEMLATGSFHDSHPLDWSALKRHEPFLDLTRALVRLRRDHPALRAAPVEVRHRNAGAGVLAYRRHDGQGHEVMVLANLSGTDFSSYRFGVPAVGTWQVAFHSGDPAFGLGHAAEAQRAEVRADAMAYDDYPASVEVSLPAWGAVVLTNTMR